MIHFPVCLSGETLSTELSKLAYRYILLYGFSEI